MAIDARVASARVVALLLVLALAACGGDPDGEPTAVPVAPAGGESRPATPSAPAPSPPLAAAPSPSSPHAPSPAPQLDAVAGTLALVEVARLEQPTATTLRSAEPDAVYVTERTGRVRVIRGGQLTDEVVLDLRERTVAEGERGLLGVAFSPDGRTLYASYTDPSGDSRLDAYDMNARVADPASRRELLALHQPFANHNGGHVVVGDDGLLWLGLGDGGGAGDPHGNGQDTTTLLGTLLRLAPDGAPAPGNPGFPRPEIWAYGLRNPWRFSFDAATGDLWIGDVGQRRWEEIDFLPAPDRGRGANLGWNLLEASHPFAAESAPGTVLPIAEYARDQGRCSVIGGLVYRGDAVPALHGAYVYGDYCGGQVVALVQEGGQVTQQAALGVEVPELVHIGADAAGELVLLSLRGPVYRLRTR